MKKLTVFLAALGLSVGVMAKNVDATHSQTAAMFKHYVLQNNNIDKCLFPAIYRSDDNGEDTLDKWWLDTENGGRMKYAYYLKLKLRLAQKTMSSDVAEMFHNGKLSSELQEQYEQAVEKYGKRTTQKNCKVVQKYAQNLIENYDETNERWRKAFPNP